MKKVLFLFLVWVQLGLSQQIEQVEYWFNDNFAERVLQNVTTNAYNETDISIPFPDDGTNEFNETLYFRFKDGAGNWSVVHSSQMLNKNDPYLYPVEMQYWFDDNFEARASVPTTGELIDGVFRQTADIDWQNGSEIIHYRFKSKYNQWTAIQSSHIDQMPNVNNKIVLAEYWLNNDFENRLTTIILGDNSFYLDTRDLDFDSDIQETIHLRYKDKMNRWSSVYSFFSDYQGDETEPTPTGNISLIVSKMAGGKVTLSWNSVTNGKLYMLYRNGIYWRSLENTHHPQNLEVVDFPPLGTHDYYVVARNYLNPNSVTSNIGSETILQEDIDAQNDINNPDKYGVLSGIISDADGNRIDDVQVTYSHDGYTVYSNLGQFLREGIPLGTQGNISLSKPGYTFAPVTSSGYTISEPMQTLSFIGTGNEAGNQTFSVEQTSGFTATTSNPQFNQPFETRTTIKNIGSVSWSGKIQLVANVNPSPNWENSKIIDEIQITNLGVGEERFIEFVVNNLKLQPANYTLKLFVFRFSENVNSTISGVKITNGMNLNNTITVGNSLSITSLSDALAQVESALENSQVFTEILMGGSSGMFNEVLNTLLDDIETQVDYIGKANQVITAINDINALMTANSIKDYWKALKKLNDYCNTPFCKVILGMYVKPTDAAINAIEAIENMTFTSIATNSFQSGGKLHLKIIKEEASSLNLWQTKYFQVDEFKHQIKSVHFIGESACCPDVEYNCIMEIGCENSDSQTLCITPEQQDNSAITTEYTYFVKIIWTNGKITYVPFGTAYFDNINLINYQFKLNASAASKDASRIQVSAQSIFFN